MIGDDATDELAKVKRQRDFLRGALIDLVGAAGDDELRQMETILRLTNVPADDKTAMLNAIHVLLNTAYE